MPQGIMPLPETDYAAMNVTHSKLFEITEKLPPNIKYYVTNVTSRLAEVDWITRELDKQVKARVSFIPQEGLLSLQLYLLLTCADTLGHVYSAGGVGERFREFFAMLPQEAKQKLVDGIFVWKTDFSELVPLNLGNVIKKTVFYPSRQQILQAIQSLTFDERYETVVESLYLRRNYYTHEAQYLTLGYHPNLSVIQKLRLNVPDTGTQGELDRLQPDSKDTYIFSITEDFSRLDAGQLTSSLRTQFGNKSTVLAPQAKVEVVRPGSRWEIVDINNRFIIRNENGKLKVFVPNIYFIYYETNDAVAMLRWATVRGLGRIIGTV